MWYCHNLPICPTLDPKLSDAVDADAAPWIEGLERIYTAWNKQGFTVLRVRDMPAYVNGQNASIPKHVLRHEWRRRVAIGLLDRGYRVQLTSTVLCVVGDEGSASARQFTVEELSRRIVAKAQGSASFVGIETEMKAYLNEVLDSDLGDMSAYCHVEDYKLTKPFEKRITALAQTAMKEQSSRTWKVDYRGIKVQTLEEAQGCWKRHKLKRKDYQQVDDLTRPKCC